MDALVYQHFRKDEHPFIDMVSGWIQQVEDQYAPYLTDFLDPRQALILETLVRSNSELRFSFYGGYESAERRRGMIYPDYYEPPVEEFKLTLYEINYPKKFAKLSHGKVLGTLVSTGLRREFFGDIISDGESWQFFVSEEVANFVETQLTKIDNFSVKLEQRKYTEVITPKDNWELEQGTVSSLRVDTVVASVFNISRQRAKLLIDSNKVKINWAETTRTDFTLELLDIVSIRGFGRIQLQEINGQSKKGKFRVKFGVLRK